MKVGIIGCGAIANIIASNMVPEKNGINIKYFFDKDIERAENLASFAGGVAVIKLEDMLDDVVLVVECASPDSVKLLAPKILEKGIDMIIMSIGAFMDWGLEKDILMPFKEMVGKVREGKEYLVYMYMDKSNRPCVSMRLYDHLSADSPYKKGDEVEGYVYQINDKLGAFVAVDNRYQGLIPKQELHKKLHIGDVISLRITEVREDGKLNLSMGQPAYKQMEVDSEMVYEAILSYDGVLPFNDKASPEIIEREMGLSKNAFKRAIGRQMKQGRVEISGGKIRKVK